MLTDHWPLRGLRVRTGRLELRLPDEEELARVAETAARGVHPPDARPFLTPWTDRPPRELARYVVQRHWARLGAWTPADWALELVVFADGEPVGIQDVRAADFAVRREVVSGSWLGLAHQGHGYGREMRAAMLHLAFAGLGAESAASLSLLDNPASAAVSRALGYREDGITRDARDGRPVTSQRYRLSRADWSAAPARLPATVEGLTPSCLELFGAAGS